MREATLGNDEAQEWQALMREFAFDDLCCAKPAARAKMTGLMIPVHVAKVIGTRGKNARGMLQTQYQELRVRAQALHESDVQQMLGMLKITGQSITTGEGMDLLKRRRKPRLVDQCAGLVEQWECISELISTKRSEIDALRAAGALHRDTFVKAFREILDAFDLLQKQADVCEMDTASARKSLSSS